VRTLGGRRRLAAVGQHAAESQDLVAQVRGVVQDPVPIVERRDQEVNAVLRLTRVERARLAALPDRLAEFAALAFGGGAKQPQPPPGDV
jgi:hypothetical protein